MTDEEFDLIFGDRLKRCTAAKHLPDDFSSRLLAEVRRKQHVRRRWVVLVGVILAAVGFALGVMPRPKAASACEAVLTAGTTGGAPSQVTGWMFLGCLRECFRRTKSGRRKDEDEPTP